MRYEQILQYYGFPVFMICSSRCWVSEEHRVDQSTSVLSITIVSGGINVPDGGGGGVSVPLNVHDWGVGHCFTGVLNLHHRGSSFLWGYSVGPEFIRGVQPTLLGVIVPVGYSNYMTRGSVFIRGNSAYIIGGHCSCGVLTLHDLGCHWCKNEPRRNDDWSNQCKNDIYDVVWWLLLECHCTPNITPFQSCKCYCLDRGFSTYGTRTSTGTRTGNRWLMETVLQYCLLIILALVVRQG
jgi:hypothetical protein